MEIIIPKHGKHSRYSTIFFDFGGVLSPPLEVLFQSYEEKTGIKKEELANAMYSVAKEMEIPTLAPIELALLTEEEWMIRIHSWLNKRKIDTSKSDLDFGRQWFSGHEVNGSMKELLLKLKASGYRVGILTNNVREWEPYWRSMVCLDDHVDAIIDSYAVGVRKPDPGIFHLAAEKISSDPNQCILIDDLMENCLSAESCGWSPVQFSSNKQVIQDIIGLLRQEVKDDSHD
ncbi:MULTISPECIES: HAD family phosphatase [unclassified Corynebacterium]|uniref:HAD family hydrolase n=1 Tax=unclassified Corynebacterium TaxID=2624378 RepID=UPI0029CA4CAC|nr:MULTISPECIES: HAD family phosphatase [unclassified Corynebacterium]WPF66034.1 HAD family phosphatase [Corynebacterium sp. 22KM0430]WPF68527.1 HAD family phosphatase [Corynebacterium sp. 21KM1197]